ncbi:MAG: triphosphoribosyl-dephospho-CoA synthase [Methylococcaceae bacterium]|nr:triphosphoribosyl-dephospho-CoA synthase [Methylococcaceae bacterium]
MISQQLLSHFYKEACEFELQAFKPGNVSVYADGHDMCVTDFRLSAQASVDGLCNPNYSLGEKIYYAVEATRAVVGCNTNLGIILLCAPLLQAAANCNQSVNFKQTLANVLDATTVTDTDWVFKAIKLASPGGLGSSAEQDVNEKPTLNLRETMQIASHKDRVALQYITNFKDVFDFGVLRYNYGFNRWRKKDWAAVLVYTGLLSQFPDSHIERKYGGRYSELVTTKMLLLDAALSDSSNPELLTTMFTEVDREFKLKGINPGTTADLTVATLLAVSLIDFLSAI